MYKCSYCDSVFMTYNVNCPNCGGCNWLTNRESELEKKPIVPSVEQEIIQEVESTFNSKFGNLISLTFALLMLGVCIWIIVTSEPLHNILNNILGI